jgi:hypothetical protein
MRFFTTFCCLILFVALSNAQNHKIYMASAGETIFSFGQVESDSVDLKNVVRFTPFFNYQQQIHFDFSKSVGMYTGLGVHNVGLITHTDEGYKIKDCSYSAGIPVMFKFGKLENGISVNVGGEAELMFAWKRKVFVDEKTKYFDWFSDNVNLFNPSAVLEIKFLKGQYIRFKYYIDDFLAGHDLVIPIPGTTGRLISGYGKSSRLFYVSIGSVLVKKQLKKEDPDTEKTNTNADAFFRNSGD